ncbi:hypothetical protein HAX54_024591 [Datura stramonium]|uniref:Oberon coiled-coil region domain-containing protein n=1 Tax=Datura stramonium TaxID=4076 RepID=A0ABS8UYA1_DATST|nr:hypothetical protein [Datura stramonium]
MLPPRPSGLPRSLFLASSDARASNDNHDPRMNSDAESSDSLLRVLVQEIHGPLLILLLKILESDKLRVHVKRDTAERDQKDGLIKSSEAGNNGRMIPPQEACNRIAAVVQEAVQTMEIVADEKMRMLKKVAKLETCDHELEEKAKEVAELKLEEAAKRLQIDELESICQA